MRLGQDCPRERINNQHLDCNLHVSMRLGQDCPRETALRRFGPRWWQRFNEAGARLPQRGSDESKNENRPDVSMRLGQDCPREMLYLEEMERFLEVSMRLGQDCPREKF